MKKILIIDDDLATCKLLSTFLTRHQYQTATAASGKEAMRILNIEKFDLIFCDYVLNDIQGKEMFEKIKSVQPDVSVIFITGYASVQVAVDLMKTGAFYYLEKPLLPEKILELIESVFNRKTTANDSPKVIHTEKSETYVKGNSVAAKMLYSNITLIAPTNYNVILIGETGTGKERLARLIHEESSRASGPYIAVDCGSLSKELAASELFGHEKGAFTGAEQLKHGAFELARNGTIFLDEIGNLSYNVQALLLRAIQERRIRKVGGSKEDPINVRIIVASNQNLYTLVKEQKFRDDLFHRLNEFTIIVPSLRERIEDLPSFINNFVALAENELNKNFGPIPTSTVDIMRHYSWPGNLRELKNFINRMCLFTPDGSSINPDILKSELAILKNEEESNTSESMPAEQETNLSNLKLVTQQAEFTKIMEVLKRVKYNKTKAAAILNIDRKTLYNKLKVN
ncbi:sigma-54-dependent transcriptional regulator [Niabella ginsengisoli]|uniref:Sigma-54 dependent transcriptional regulator n=1 Tax=Niabella ginsengisoli TaxID=522298 RepID=A0ABS9SL19_9BACT|nr:sigma-54 dependent transcriptional regulator [Niabella ginsengisoli]MCH5598849.1 sigma-54 dependent transcriptional regulator [Niabella ginsengisoli]